MKTKLFFRANPAFVFAALTIMQNMDDEYSGTTLTERAGVITVDSSRTNQVQSAVLKVYEGRLLPKYSRAGDH